MVTLIVLCGSGTKETVRVSNEITGKQIQDTALQIAKELGYDKFTASTGWLNGWQRRHNIKLGLQNASKGNSNETTKQQ